MKVTILGHFGGRKNLLNGQTIKTKIVTQELQNQLGSDQVKKIDTHGGWKTLFKAPYQVFRALKDASNVLMFPAHNGLRIYAPLLSFQKHFFRDKRIHYIVIGGWLPPFLKKRRWLAKSLKKFDGIYVETNTMKIALEKQGFENVFIMPNCKELIPLSENELIYPNEHPYKLCTFSRVMKEKGIEDAIEAVKYVNEKIGKIAYTLDIYGQVDSEQAEWFEGMKGQFPSYVKYGGLVPFDKSVEVLKDYFALLFPTRFYTEGIPGTIIDAYAAGIPVISAKWESYSDIVDDGTTGIGYDFETPKQLEEILLQIVQNPQPLLDNKCNCIRKAREYTPKAATKVLVDNISE